MSHPPIYEFSTGIYLNELPDGRIESKGFTGGYMNLNPNTKIPESIHTAINEKVFEMAQGDRSACAVMGRVVEYPQLYPHLPAYAVVATVTRFTDNFNRSLPVYRYFYCEGADNLEYLAKCLDNFKARKGEFPLFYGGENLDDYANVSAGKASYSLSDEDKAKIVNTQVKSVVLAPNSSRTLLQIHQWAKNKYNCIENKQDVTLAWAYNVQTIKFSESFLVIQANNDQAYQSLQGGTRAKNIMPYVAGADLEGFKRLYQTITSNPEIKEQDLAQLQQYLQDKRIDNEEILKQVAKQLGVRSRILKEQLPNLVMVYVLDKILRPHTFADYLEWFGQYDPSSQPIQIALQFQQSFKQHLSKFPDLEKTINKNVIPSVLKALQVEQKITAEGLIYLLTDPSSIWATEGVLDSLYNYVSTDLKVIVDGKTSGFLCGNEVWKALISHLKEKQKYSTIELYQSKLKNWLYDSPFLKNYGNFLFRDEIRKDLVEREKLIQQIKQQPVIIPCPYYQQLLDLFKKLSEQNQNNENAKLLYVYFLQVVYGYVNQNVVINYQTKLKEKYQLELITKEKEIDPNIKYKKCELNLGISINLILLTIFRFRYILLAGGVIVGGIWLEKKFQFFSWIKYFFLNFDIGSIFLLIIVVCVFLLCLAFLVALKQRAKKSFFPKKQNTGSGEIPPTPVETKTEDQKRQERETIEQQIKTIIPIILNITNISDLSNRKYKQNVINIFSKFFQYCQIKTEESKFPLDIFQEYKGKSSQDGILAQIFQSILLPDENEFNFRSFLQLIEKKKDDGIDRRRILDFQEQLKKCLNSSEDVKKQANTRIVNYLLKTIYDGKLQKDEQNLLINYLFEEKSFLTASELLELVVELFEVMSKSDYKTSILNVFSKLLTVWRNYHKKTSLEIIMREDVLNYQNVANFFYNFSLELWQKNSNNHNNDVLNSLKIAVYLDKVSWGANRLKDGTDEQKKEIFGENIPEEFIENVLPEIPPNLWGIEVNTGTNNSSSVNSTEEATSTHGVTPEPPQESAKNLNPLKFISRFFKNKVFNISLSFITLFILAFITVQWINPDPIKQGLQQFDSVTKPNLENIFTAVSEDKDIKKLGVDKKGVIDYFEQSLLNCQCDYPSAINDRKFEEDRNKLVESLNEKYGKQGIINNSNKDKLKEDLKKKIIQVNNSQTDSSSNLDETKLQKAKQMINNSIYGLNSIKQELSQFEKFEKAGVTKDTIDTAICETVGINNQCYFKLPDDANEKETYQTNLINALAKFQVSHNLPVDGMITYYPQENKTYFKGETYQTILQEVNKKISYMDNITVEPDQAIMDNALAQFEDNTKKALERIEITLKDKAEHNKIRTKIGEELKLPELDFNADTDYQTALDQPDSEERKKLIIAIYKYQQENADGILYTTSDENGNKQRMAITNYLKKQVESQL